MAAIFMTVAEMEDTKTAVPFAPELVVFGGWPAGATIKVVKNDKSNRDNAPDLRAVATIGEVKAELGALWMSERGNTYASGKVSQTVCALMGWPEKTNLLLQAPREAGQNWRLTVVIDRGAAPAEVTNGGATDGSSDFGTADDPFAEE